MIESPCANKLRPSQSETPTIQGWNWRIYLDVSFHFLPWKIETSVLSLLLLSNIKRFLVPKVRKYGWVELTFCTFDSDFRPHHISKKWCWLWNLGSQMARGTRNTSRWCRKGYFSRVTKCNGLSMIEANINLMIQLWFTKGMALVFTICWYIHA